MNTISTANIPSKQARKAIGIVKDFSVFFSAVLSIKQSQEEESSRDALNSL